MKQIIFIVLVCILVYGCVQAGKRAEKEYQDCVNAGIHSDDTCWMMVYQ